MKGSRVCALMAFGCLVSFIPTFLFGGTWNPGMLLGCAACSFACYANERGWL